MKKFFTWIVDHKWKLLIGLGGVLVALGLAFGIYLIAAPRSGTFELGAAEDAVIETNASGDRILLLPEEETLSLQALLTKNSGKTRPVRGLGRQFLHYGSNDEEIVTVDSDGTLHPVKDGFATVTGRWFKNEQQWKVHVYTPLSSFKTEQESYEAAVFETVQVKIVKDPENAYLLSAPEYSVLDPEIADVSESGLVTGRRKGETELKIRVEDQEILVPLRIYVPLESISFPEETVRLEKYRYYKLTPIWSPEDADVPSDLTYVSSDERIATVSEDGRLVGVAPGNVLITVKGGGCKTTLYAEIYSPLRHISLDKEELELVGRDVSEQLTVLFTPEDTTDPRTLGWWSSDESVAVVDQNGLVTSTGPGQCVIHVRCGNYYAECPVNVRIPMEGICFNFEQLTIHYGDTVVFPLYFIPEDTTDDRTTVWESSNPAAATVDENGAVTAVGAGETTITAKVGDFTASVAVTADIPVTGVAISQGAITLNKGQGAQLSASVIPANTTEQP